MIFSALLSHYRRHPVQALFLLLSIVMANALLVGTQLINAQSRASYADGEQVLTAGPIAYLRSRESNMPVNESDYVQLRRQGFDMLAPVLRRLVLTGEGDPVELLGIDALAFPRQGAQTQGDAVYGSQGFAGFSFAPYEVWGSPGRLEQLGWLPGERVPLRSGEQLPLVRAVPDAGLGHRLLVDIGVLQELTDSRGQLSSIMVFEEDPAATGSLLAALPAGLVYTAVEQGPDPAELTRSFHLNLAAMGLLSFVVGIFLAYNALSFSYTDRHELLRKLRLAGVTRPQLRGALLLELALYLGVGGMVGAWLGARLAASLLPGVGQTLAQLYGVYIAYPDSFSLAGMLMPLLMTAIAAALCIMVPMRQSLQAPLLERGTSGWQGQAVLRRDRLMLLAGLVLLLLAAVASVQATTTWTALAGMACLLLGAALCLPLVLRAILTLLMRLVPSQNARAGWLLADSRWLLGPASLALMAMTLALVANSGLNTMISSFRQATDDWLNQRLAAQLYFRSAEAPRGLQEWLDQQAPGVALSERYRVMLERPDPEGKTAQVELVSLQAEAQFAATIDLIRT
ncbi:MAG: hypothetical protein HKO64_10140, partial [Xanthomonadales bacterium]|nr:hypothetical protein [Xanthomonadales bacterium]